MKKHYNLTTKDQFINDISKPEISENLVAIYCGWAGFAPIGGLTSSIIDHLPSSVKVVTACSVGFDPYDTKALAARGIQFYNTPSLGADHVADLVLWHVLESFRRFSIFQTKARETGDSVVARGVLQSHGFENSTGTLGTNQNEWEKESYPFGHIAGGKYVSGPRGKKVGIIGFGKIGQLIGLRCWSLGMNVVYNKRTPLNQDELSKLVYKPEFKKLEELLKECEVVIIACPGNDSTRNLLSKERIDLLNSSAKVINVGRGFIIDESYLITKLQRGELEFLGLDVFTGEPIINPELLHRSDVSLTPHIGSSTRDVFDNTAIFCLHNIVDVVVKGQEGRSRVV